MYNKEWFHDQICVQKKSFMEIASETGHDRQALSRWAKEFGIYKPEEIYSDREWLHDQFCVQRKTFLQIANETGADNKTISIWAKKFGLQGIRDLYRNKEWLYDQYCIKNNRLEEISKLCRISRPRVLQWIKKYGLKRRRWNSYSLDENYFNKIDTQDKAYWLGFLAADGCVMNRPGKRILTIHLAKKDGSHLELFSKCIGSNKPVSYRSDGTVQLDICSVVMAADLVKHGIVERKSMVLKPPNIQQELMRHWIRGYFDGDGSVHRSMVGNLQGDMVGTLEVMDFILSHCSILRGPYKKGNQYAVRFGGNRRAKHLYDYLYNDSNVCLTRKKQIFEKKREV